MIRVLVDVDDNCRVLIDILCRLPDCMSSECFSSRSDFSVINFSFLTFCIYVEEDKLIYDYDSYYDV